MIGPDLVALGAVLAKLTRRERRSMRRRRELTARTERRAVKAFRRIQPNSHRKEQLHAAV